MNDGAVILKSTNIKIRDMDLMNKDRNNYEKYRSGAQSAPLREVIQYTSLY